MRDRRTGPVGSGPSTLVEGLSSLANEIGLIQAEPLVWVWLDTGTPRSQRGVPEANRDHWNSERGPRLERVVFRNELAAGRGPGAGLRWRGGVDIVTEVAPAAAQQVVACEHAKLVRVDAMGVLAGIVNRDAEGAPLHDVRARRALNLAVDRDRLIREVFAGVHAPPVLLRRGRVPGRPPVPQFDDLLGRFAVATDQRVVTELTTDLDRLADDQALSGLLCAPRRWTRSTATSASTAMPPPSSWPRPRSHRNTGPAADPATRPDRRTVLVMARIPETPG